MLRAGRSWRGLLDTIRTLALGPRAGDPGFGPVAGGVEAGLKIELGGEFKDGKLKVSLPLVSFEIGINVDYFKYLADHTRLGYPEPSYGRYRYFQLGRGHEVTCQAGTCLETFDGARSGMGYIPQ